MGSVDVAAAGVAAGEGRAGEGRAAEITLPIGGMTCAACQSHVEGALLKTQGVESATVNLITRSARVGFDPQVTSEAALVDAVKSSGYDAALPSGTESVLAKQRRDDVEIAREARGLFVRALVLLGGMGLTMLAMSVMPHEAHAVVNAGLILFTAVLAVACAHPIFRRAFAAARRGQTQMDTLVALGALAAFAASVFSRESYLESVTGILGFVTLGNALEATARRRTTRALTGLASLSVNVAHLEVSDAEEKSIPVDDLRRGDVILVRPGERIAADAVVLEGTGGVDESALTGEAVPVVRKPGDAIVGGTLNVDGSFRARVTAMGDETILSQLVALLREAQSRRAPIQRLADRVSAVFVPVAIGISLVTFAAWMFLDAGVLVALRTAVATLVIACPCAMGLAIPTAVMVATGRAARAGLLIRGGEALQRLAAIDAVVFDKTGTLTLGQPRVTGVHGDARTLAIAAALEKGAEHPFAKAILERAAAENVVVKRARRITVSPGLGVSGEVDGKQCVVGSARLLVEAVSRETRAVMDESAARGETPVVVAESGSVIGVIAIADDVRPSARTTIDALKKRGMHVAMLTGDREATAARVAASVAIDHVHAEVLPAGKVDVVRKLQSEGRRVAMVGDGINDAPALAQADVGIALASGTDIAMDAADVTIVRGDLTQVVVAIDHAKNALALMKRNLFWALAYNVVAIPAAAGLFSPWGIHVSPIMASLAMSLSSVSVVVSSLSLRR